MAERAGEAAEVPVPAGARRRVNIRPGVCASCCVQEKENICLRQSLRTVGKEFAKQPCHALQYRRRRCHPQVRQGVYLFVRCLAERHCSPRDRIPCLAVLFAKPVQTNLRHKKFGLVCGGSAFSHHGVRWLPGSLARRHVAICPMRSWAEERRQIILFTQRNKNAKKQHLSPCHPFRTQPRDSLAAATAARAHRHWHRPPWCRPGAKLATHLRRS